MRLWKIKIITLLLSVKDCQVKHFKNFLNEYI
jgi:hypothetical protein